MRTSRARALGIVVTIVAVVVGGVAGAGPVSATPAATTFLQATGDVGDPVVGPTEYLFTTTDTTFGMSAGGTDWMMFVVDQPSAAHYWTMTFGAYYGQDFVVGKTYTDVGWFPDATHGSLQLHADQRDCSTSRGAFTVLQLARDPGTGLIAQFAATFDLRCQVPGPASHGTIYYNATLPYQSGASLALAGLDREPAGEPVTLAGSLSDGTAKIAGATLSVRRTDQSGTTDLADVITGVDGTYAVHDTMPTTTATYAVVFVGDASVQGMMATHVVLVGLYVTSLSATAPATAARGSTYALTGHLISGGAAQSGATLAVTRTDLVGKRALQVTTKADGTYAIVDKPAVGGAVTWSIAWAGDATHAAATAKTVVSVPRTATALTITTSAATYKYGAKASARVHLGTTFNRRDVYVYVRPLGPTAVAAPGRLIAHARVGSKGDLVVTWTITATTVVTASFSGDYRYTPTVRTRTPKVVSKVAIQATGSSRKSGSTLVYTGTRAYFRAAVAPARPGGCMSWVAQRYVGRTWRLVDTLTCARIGSDKRSYVAFTRGSKGVKLRIRAYVKGNTYSLAGGSAWVYFTFR